MHLQLQQQKSNSPSACSSSSSSRDFSKQETLKKTFTIIVGSLEIIKMEEVRCNIKFVQCNDLMCCTAIAKKPSFRKKWLFNANFRKKIRFLHKWLEVRFNFPLLL